MKRILVALGLAGALLGPDAGAAAFTVQGAAEPLLPGVVSRDFRETGVAVHPDGRLIVFACDDCPRNRKRDLWLAVPRGADWTLGGKAKQSRPDDEAAPAWSPDGVWFYLTSDRKGGVGGIDLYRVAYSPVRHQFAQLENLGPAVNSPGEEGRAAPLAGDAGLLFASRGRDGARGWALFRSLRRGGKLAPAERLRALDSGDDEFDPLLLPDGSLLFARAPRDQPQRSAIWFAARAGDGFAQPQRLPAPVNLDGAGARAPALDAREPGVLLFTRLDADGGSDILRVRYAIAD